MRSLLVFTLVVGNFAVATLLGHKVLLLSVLTYITFNSEMGSDPIMQSTLASVSIFIVAATLFVQRWVVGRKRHEITQGRGAASAPTGHRIRTRRKGDPTDRADAR